MEPRSDLAERFGSLLFDEKTSDMTLIVEGWRLPAHRLIIATSCRYFRALLLGKMKESFQEDVILENVPLRGFKCLMAYIYTGQLSLEKLDKDTSLELLGIVHMYGFGKLQNTLCQHLRAILSTENVCEIYHKAGSLHLKKLADACHDLLMTETDAILKSESFCDLSDAVLCHAISRDTFCAEEIEIFKAVQKWCAKRPSVENISNVLKAIRLPLIRTKDLVSTVEDSGLFSMDLLVDAIRTRKCRRGELNIRGILRPEVNLATPDHGARELREHPFRDMFISSKNRSYESRPLHWKTMGPHDGLILELGKPSFINAIGFRLHEKDRECRYYIEASINLEDWVRIIDHSNFKCSGVQCLSFEPRVVRYIRVVGTRCPTVRYVRCPGFLVLYSTKFPKFINGILAPEKMMTTFASGAIVTESLNGSNGLIRRKYSATDQAKDIQWTSHEIGNGSITIKLSQPLVVSSMRMLLRSDGSRAYRYYIETSVDEKNWTRVADRTTELCRSWQDIFFEAHPVLYVKIVGTESEGDKNFTCSYFECPASNQRPGGDPAQNSGDLGGAAKRMRIG